MTPGGQPDSPVLVYDRIANNRRKTWLLVACAVLALAPFVLGISYGFAAMVVAQISPEARSMRATVRQERQWLKSIRQAEVERTEWEADLEQRLAAHVAEAERLEGENRSLRMKLMPVVAAALIAALGVLFWGIASSPTSRLLVQAGANPAGPGEEEVRRLLENLCIGAGLPVPKLYVIETSAPNAFAAGIHPDQAVVAVTRGALKLFDRRELEGVLAHELSHIGNHDIRLNTIVATIALFLRIPYLIFRRELSPDPFGTRRPDAFGIWRFALTPVGLYVVFIAPFVAALIRAAVSRQREFLADADAALLTRYPEGLMRALAKIGGAGSSMTGSNPAFSHFYFANPIDSRGWFSGNMMATHPPISERIERLVGYQGQDALVELEQAVKEGREYRKNRPSVGFDAALDLQQQDELAALNQGNVMGRVYRVVASRQVVVYEQPNVNSCRVATLDPGALVVVFDDPGVMRQVNTANQIFGYLEQGVKLKSVDDVIPAEVYDPKLRAAAETRLAARLSVAEMRPGPKGLSVRQLAIACGFGVAVFAGMLLLLVKLGG